MVSNARLLLPLPERPVITTSRSRGRSTSMSRRLCSRAPRTEMRSGSPAGTAFGARGARGELGTAVATVRGVAFFPFVPDFPERFTGAFAGGSTARAGGLAAVVVVDFLAVFFAAGRVVAD